MGKGSNVQKSTRAREDAAKKAAAAGVGGGGSKGIQSRNGDTAALMEQSQLERAKLKLEKEKFQQDKEAKRLKEEKQMAKKNGQVAKTKKNNDVSALDGY